MSGTARSSEGLDARRRKLLFRSWHRGIREMDLILGGFADDAIGSLTDAELHQYEHLLEVQDADLLAWVTGTDPVPTAFDAPLLKKITGLPGHLKNDFISLLEKIGLPEQAEPASSSSMASPTASRPSRWRPPSPKPRPTARCSSSRATASACRHHRGAGLRRARPAGARIPPPGTACPTRPRLAGLDAACPPPRRAVGDGGAPQVAPPRDHPHHRQCASPAHPAGRSDRGAGFPRQARQQRQHERADRASWRNPASSACRPCATSASSPCAAASSTSARPVLTRRCASISSATRWRRCAPSTSPPSAPPARATRCRCSR